MSDKTIKVMVVEDSAYMRYVISELLDSDPDITVVEKARDGVDALEKLRRTLPDVITLDIQMPRMDGLQFLAEVRKEYRIPTIMFSSITIEGAEDTIKALELGAFDFLTKPTGASGLTLEEVQADLLSKVKAASLVKPIILAPRAEDPVPVPPPAPPEDAPEAPAPPAASILSNGPASSKKKKPERDINIPMRKVVAVGCSTGGPRALTEIIPLLPADLPACVLIVQHMPARFTASLASRLDAISEIHVREAANGDKVCGGMVYIAPGDYHMLAGRGDVIYLNQDAQQHGVRPSVNVLMKSVAKTYGGKTIGVVLTGMGSDGSGGVIEIASCGGEILAEAEATCVVYGMPRAAVETGKVTRVVSLHKMADEIIAAVYS